MKKLLLTLTLAAGATSLHGMEPQKQLSPISLAQTFHQFLHSEPALPQDVTQQIFSFYLKARDIDLVNISQKLRLRLTDPKDLVHDIKKLLDSYGYELASGLCKHYFSHAKTSICDIKKKSFGFTALHCATLDDLPEAIKVLLNTAGNNALTLLTMRDKEGYTALHTAAYCSRTEIVKLLLNTAGDNAWKLLTIRDKTGATALHTAAFHGCTEVVKLLLNAAGDNVQDFMAIKDTTFGCTAFDIAKPKAKEVMQPYLHKNNQ